MPLRSQCGVLNSKYSACGWFCKMWSNLGPLGLKTITFLWLFYMGLGKDDGWQLKVPGIQFSKTSKLWILGFDLSWFNLSWLDLPLLYLSWLHQSRITRLPFGYPIDTLKAPSRQLYRVSTNTLDTLFFAISRPPKHLGQICWPFLRSLWNSESRNVLDFENR